MAMSLQYWFQSTMGCLLPICNLCWASAMDIPLDFPALLHHRQVRPSICQNFKCDFSKKLPCLKLILFLQTFTGQNQVTPTIDYTIQSLLSTLVILSWANHICSQQSILSAPSYAFLQLSIKQTSIFTEDILSKIA